MSDLLTLVHVLEEERKVPQYLFFNAIHGKSMSTVRKDLIDFRRSGGNTKEIDFIIHSPGGSPPDAYRIIRSLRNTFEKVNVVVPFWAKSAATLLSLGANRIIMDEFGEFGPLDLQIGVEKEYGPEVEMESTLNDEYSVRRIEARSQELFYQMFVNLYSSKDVKINKNELSNQILEYLASFYEPLLSQINPYHLGRKKRLLDIGEEYAKRILLAYTSISQEKMNYLIDYLVNRCPDHGYVIDYNILAGFLDNVVLSKTLGAKYAETLTDLATELIHSPSVQFVGFPPKLNASKPKEKDKQDADDTSSAEQTNNSDVTNEETPSDSTKPLNDDTTEPSHNGSREERTRQIRRKRKR